MTDATNFRDLNNMSVSVNNKTNHQSVTKKKNIIIMSNKTFFNMTYYIHNI